MHVFWGGDLKPDKFESTKNMDCVSETKVL